MMQPLSAAILCLLSPGLDGGRRIAKSNASGNIGRVTSLHTFGAPHVSTPPLFKEGGCMDGYRIIAYKDIPWYLGGVDKEDIVPTLLVPTKYEHPHIKTLKVNPDKSGKTEGEWSCGKNPTRITVPETYLHDKNLYLRTMRIVPASHIKVKQAAAVGLRNSYETDVNKVKANLRGEGFRLVGRAVAGEDVVNLMQDEKSRRCIITFEGSDSFGDWMDNLSLDRVGFCGLKARVHEGFKKELMRVIGSAGFQQNLRPKLGKCAALDVTGHSLGGATASLFAACVNGQKSGEYNMMSWNMEAAELMSSL